MNPDTSCLLATVFFGACWGPFLKAACSKGRPQISIHTTTVAAVAALMFAGCYLLSKDPISACLLGGVFALYGLIAIYDNFTFAIPNLALYGAMLLAAGIAIFCPSITNPALLTHQLAAATLSLFAGGLALTSVLLAIKNLAESVMSQTVQFDGTLHVSADGLIMASADGAQEIKWEEFCFKRIIPIDHLKVQRSGAAETINGGEVEIRDGELRIRGESLELSKGPVAISCQKLLLQRAAMGSGDIYLAPSLGTLIGLNWGLFEMLLMASVTGTLHGLYLKRTDRRLPFGPHLILATTYVFLMHHNLVPSLVLFRSR